MEEPVTHIQQLEQLSAELDGIFFDMKSRQEGSAARIVRLEKEYERARELSDELMRKSAVREDELATAARRAQSELSDLRSSVERLTAERDELRASLEDASRRLSQEQERCAQKEELVNSAAASAREREKESARVWKKLEETKAELDHVRAETRPMASELKRIAELNSELEIELKKCRAENLNIQEGFSAKIAMLKREIESKEKDIVELSASLKERGK